MIFQPRGVDDCVRPRPCLELSDTTIHTPWPIDHYFGFRCVVIASSVQQVFLNLPRLHPYKRSVVPHPSRWFYTTITCQATPCLTVKEWLLATAYDWGSESQSCSQRRWMNWLMEAMIPIKNNRHQPSINSLSYPERLKEASRQSQEVFIFFIRWTCHTDSATDASFGLQQKDFNN